MMFCLLNGDLGLWKISCMDDRRNHKPLQYISNTEYQDVYYSALHIQLSSYSSSYGIIILIAELLKSFQFYFVILIYIYVYLIAPM